ncbi:GNAT family N-acetyltransferase [Saccharibacillus sp. JS10]|uniref:GNAT family N-acetyltransferase n=1 Tax=Saccharibacillus sp. JS10 TaxID=2950552 RepID=UPI00210E88A3|nr:GNAT family N-acetyltransferase [Saccharibacillus sp. JS10]MCQ4085724.1 GNAT family N-acetyltransferase [Saccharibacillus sp. JS10]
MLNEQQLQDIKSLQRICETQDDICLKLNDDMLQMDSRKTNMDYFYYENDVLIGFLALYGFGGQVEVCGMVHPNYRKQGVFTSLWNQALSSGRIHEASTVLLNAPQASLAAADWLKKIGASYSFSEYEMAWQKDLMPEFPAASVATSASYRPYEDADLELVLRLYNEGFGSNDADTLETLQEEDRNPRRVRSMVVYRQQTIGTLVMDYDTPLQAGIFGFVIDAAYRGQGIGRSILMQMIRREVEAGLQPHIGVETQNANALKLYENCGFRSYAVQDYYELSV